MMAYAHMYRATGDTQYLQKLFALADKVMAMQDDLSRTEDVFKGKVVPGWGSDEYTKGKWHVWADSAARRRARREQEDCHSG